jgi:hypothetical protein
VGLGAGHAVDLVEPVGDDVGQVLVVADLHHGDEVRIAGDRVDLRHAVQLRDALAHLRDAVDVAADHDDGGDHGTIELQVCACPPRAERCSVRRVMSRVMSHGRSVMTTLDAT